MNLKKVYIAKLRHGLGGPIRVYASDEAEAKKNAFSTYTFCSAQWHPNPNIDDIIVDIKLDDNQIMGGTWIQPVVQIEGYKRPTVKELLAEQFPGVTL